MASDQGQPAYETMQPLQVALDDIDDNEPIFLRPPVRHRGGHRGARLGTHMVEHAPLDITAGCTMAFVHFQPFKA